MEHGAGGGLEPAIGKAGCQPPGDGRGLTRCRGDHLKPCGSPITDKRVIRHHRGKAPRIGKFRHMPTSLNEQQPVEFLVAFRIADDRGERRDAGAGGEHPQRFARRQRIYDQRAGGFAAHPDRIARTDMLEAFGKRAARNLDRIEFQRLVPVRRGDGIGPENRTVPRRIPRQSDHHELAGAETETRRPCHPETEQAVGVMLDLRHRFGKAAIRR